ncbi:DUF4974 domain-containing protein [Dyadobacter sp. CY261]|uniref:FecR domain-containing protein n=1 Tax=Dyadobacter sp. CY261 TaxID=2907203 RepID=UPI001F3983DA|nr:FecR domain-containing protein [Dyadobacter sp. CY261]MCF0072931.1 DUF4974 domain-containing protein [Dyadobacter sp. CY261]
MSPKPPDARYLELAGKWMTGTITSEERQEFADWYNHNQDEEVQIPTSHASDEQEHRDRLLADIRDRISQTEHRRRFWLFRPSVAAALVFLLLGAGAYFLMKHQAMETDVPVSVVTDVAPGSDKATLTLGDGSVLILDELADGALKLESQFSIRKKDGELIYEAKEGSKTSAPTYNTISTPRGGQFRVVLPDGSKVWLNASSSLRYPTTFTGSERPVRLCGEGYFEVAKSRLNGRSVPFRINVNDRETVEVLGTHFNIMAYAEERTIKTTLLEGSVRVTKPGKPGSSLLRPGQQCVYDGKKGFVVRSDIDARESISWKNGIISFEDADIETIMRQIERWYDVRVEYRGEIPRRLFTGGISRKSNLSGVLKVLELNNIHFEIRNKVILVSP